MTARSLVLLACGSYNPVTNMHLRLFELARDSLKTAGFRVVGGIISPVNDHYGKKDLVTALHRCRMVELALESNPWICMDTWEAQQPTWSRTLVALQHYQEALDSAWNKRKPKSTKHQEPLLPKCCVPTRSTAEEIEDVAPESTAVPAHSYDKMVLDGPAQLRFLCGADLVKSFDDSTIWSRQDIDIILSKFGLVVVTRAGVDLEKFIYERDYLHKHKDNIHLVSEWVLNEVSATKVRCAIKRGLSVKYLLQESVIDYIRNHKLYMADSSTESATPASEPLHQTRPMYSFPSTDNESDLESFYRKEFQRMIDSMSRNTGMPTSHSWFGNGPANYARNTDKRPIRESVTFSGQFQSLREHFDHRNGSENQRTPFHMWAEAPVMKVTCCVSRGTMTDLSGDLMPKKVSSAAEKRLRKLKKSSDNGYQHHHQPLPSDNNQSNVSRPMRRTVAFSSRLSECQKTDESADYFSLSRQSDFINRFSPEDEQMSPTSFIPQSTSTPVLSPHRMNNRLPAKSFGEYHGDRQFYKRSVRPNYLPIDRIETLDNGTICSNYSTISSLDATAEERPMTTPPPAVTCEDNIVSGDQLGTLVRKVKTIRVCLTETSV